MGYNIKQKPMKKLDFSKMKTRVQEPVVKDYMHYYKEKIKDLRQRLYQLMRITDGKRNIWDE